MPIDAMQEIIGANENNANGTREIVANAIESIQAMPDCENIAKNVLKATTGFESLAEAAKASGKSTSDILDRVASVFEKISARANQAQASVYGFGDSFGKVNSGSLVDVEKRIKSIKSQFDLTSSSIGNFSKQLGGLNVGPAHERGSSGDSRGSATGSAMLTSQERMKLRAIAKFLDMSGATLFRKTLSLSNSGNKQTSANVPAAPASRQSSVLTREQQRAQQAQQRAQQRAQQAQQRAQQRRLEIQRRQQRSESAQKGWNTRIENTSNRVGGDIYGLMGNNSLSRDTQRLTSAQSSDIKRAVLQQKAVSSSRALNGGSENDKKKARAISTIFSKLKYSSDDAMSGAAAIAKRYGIEFDKLAEQNVSVLQGFIKSLESFGSDLGDYYSAVKKQIDEAADAAKKAKEQADELELERIKAEAESDTERHRTINGARFSGDRAYARKLQEQFATKANSINNDADLKKAYSYISKQIGNNRKSNSGMASVVGAAQKAIGDNSLKLEHILNGKDSKGNALSAENIKKIERVMQELSADISDARENTANFADVLGNADEAAEEFGKSAIRGMGILGELLKGNVVGTMAMVGAIAIGTKAIVDLLEKIADFAPQMAQLSADYDKMRQSVAAFSGQSVDFDSLRNQLTLTRQEAVELGEAYQKIAISGVHSVDTVTTMARSMKETMGKVDISTLKEAVDLIDSLPKEQVDVLIHGVGSMDDEANLIANLMEDGNLDRVIKLQMSGAFGEQEGMPKLSEKDKAVIDAQKDANRILEDMNMLLYDKIPGIASANSVIASKIVSLLFKVASFATTTYLTGRAVWKMARAARGNAIRTTNSDTAGLGDGGSSIFKHGFNRRGLSRGILKIGGRTNVGRSLARFVAGSGRSVASGARVVGTAAKAGGAVAKVGGTAAGATSGAAGGAAGAAGAAGTGVMGMAGGVAAAGIIAYLIAKPIAMLMEKYADKLKRVKEASRALNRGKNEAVYGNPFGRDIYDDTLSVKIAGVEGAAKGLMIGATSGAMIGALVGSIVPGLGTVIGGLIGGLIGAVGGGLAGKYMAEREEKQKNLFHHDKKRKWWEYAVPTFSRNNTTKTNLLSVLKLAAPGAGTLADIFFGDNHKRVNEDPSGKRKKYYDEIHDNLDDYFMGLTGKVATDTTGKAIAVPTGQKDKEGRPIRGYMQIDEKTGRVLYDRTGKPIIITIEKFRQMNMKRLLELNKSVKQLEMIVKERYTQFQKQMYEAAYANMNSIKNIGGTDEDYSKMKQFAAEQNLRSHTMKMDKLNELKTKTIQRTDMDHAQKANLLAKIMQDEAKIHEQYADNLLKIIGEIEKVPGVFINEVKARIDESFGKFSNESFGGTLASAAYNSQSVLSSSFASSDAAMEQFYEDVDLVGKQTAALEENLANLNQRVAEAEAELGMNAQQASAILDLYHAEQQKLGVDEQKAALASLGDALQTLEPLFNKAQTKDGLTPEEQKQALDQLPTIIAQAELQRDKVSDPAKKQELQALIDSLKATETAIKDGNAPNSVNDITRKAAALRALLTEEERRKEAQAKANVDRATGFQNAVGKAQYHQGLQVAKASAKDARNLQAEAEKKLFEKIMSQIRGQSERFVDQLDQTFNNGAKRFAEVLENFARDSLKYLQYGQGGEGAVSDYIDKQRKSLEATWQGLDASRNNVLPMIEQRIQSKMDSLPEFAAKHGWNEAQTNYAMIYGQLQQARNEVLKNPEDQAAQERVRQLEMLEAQAGAAVDPEFLTNNKQFKIWKAEIESGSAAFKKFNESILASRRQLVEAWEGIVEILEKKMQDAIPEIARFRASAATSKLDYNNRYVDSTYAFRNGAQIAKTINDSADKQLEYADKGYELAKQKAKELYDTTVQTTGDEQKARELYDKAMLEAEDEYYKKRSDIQSKRLEQLNKVYDAKLSAIGRRTEAMEIQKDVLETIGAPFEYILDIEQQMVKASKEKAAIEEQHLQDMIAGGVQGQELEEQKLKVAKAQAEVIKNSFGAQRDSLDKMLGKILGTFNEVGGIFGPNSAYSQVRKLGQGYVTNAQTGLNWAAGDDSATGYANRVANTTGAISGHQMPSVRGYSSGGNTATEVKRVGEGLITEGKSARGDKNTFLTDSDHLINANNYEWIIKAEDFSRFAKANGMTNNELFNKIRAGAPDFAYGGATRMTLNHALFGTKDTFAEEYGDTRKSYEDLVNEKIDAYRRLGVFTLNNADSDVFDEKGMIKQLAGGNRYNPLGPNAAGIRPLGSNKTITAAEGAKQGLSGADIASLPDPKGTAAKSDTSGEASAGLVDTMTKKVSRTGELDNTGQPKKASGAATKSEKFLLELLKDTHSIVELLGGESDWDAIESLEGSIDDNKQAMQSLQDNTERNQFLAEDVGGELAGKTTGEIQSEFKKIINPKGERSEGSLKRQRKLETALLYDKLFKEKKEEGEESETLKESQDKSVDVQREILRYVKLIYEVLLGYGGASVSPTAARAARAAAASTAAAIGATYEQVTAGGVQGTPTAHPALPMSSTPGKPGSPYGHPVPPPARPAGTPGRAGTPATGNPNVGDLFPNGLPTAENQKPLPKIDLPFSYEGGESMKGTWFNPVTPITIGAAARVQGFAGGWKDVGRGFARAGKGAVRAGKGVARGVKNWLKSPKSQPASNAPAAPKQTVVGKSPKPKAPPTSASPSPRPLDKIDTNLINNAKTPRAQRAVATRIAKQRYPNFDKMPRGRRTALVQDIIKESQGKGTGPVGQPVPGTAPKTNAPAAGTANPPAPKPTPQTAGTPVPGAPKAPSAGSGYTLNPSAPETTISVGPSQPKGQPTLSISGNEPTISVKPDMPSTEPPISGSAPKSGGLPAPTAPPPTAPAPAALPPPSGAGPRPGFFRNAWNGIKGLPGKTWNGLKGLPGKTWRGLNKFRNKAIDWTNTTKGKSALTALTWAPVAYDAYKALTTSGDERKQHLAHAGIGAIPAAAATVAMFGKGMVGKVAGGAVAPLYAAAEMGKTWYDMKNASPEQMQAMSEQWKNTSMGSRVWDYAKRAGTAFALGSFFGGPVGGLIAAGADFVGHLGSDLIQRHYINKHEKDQAKKYNAQVQANYQQQVKNLGYDEALGQYVSRNQYNQRRQVLGRDLDSGKGPANNASANRDYHRGRMRQATNVNAIRTLDDYARGDQQSRFKMFQKDLWREQHSIQQRLSQGKVNNKEYAQLHRRLDEIRKLRGAKNFDQLVQVADDIAANADDKNKGSAQTQAAAIRALMNMKKPRGRDVNDMAREAKERRAANAGRPVPGSSSGSSSSGSSRAQSRNAAAAHIASGTTAASALSGPRAVSGSVLPASLFTSPTSSTPSAPSSSGSYMGSGSSGRNASVARSSYGAKAYDSGRPKWAAPTDESEGGENDGGWTDIKEGINPYTGEPCAVITYYGPSGRPYATRYSSLEKDENGQTIIDRERARERARIERRLEQKRQEEAEKDTFIKRWENWDNFANRHNPYATTAQNARKATVQGIKETFKQKYGREADEKGLTGRDKKYYVAQKMAEKFGDGGIDLPYGDDANKRIKALKDEANKIKYDIAEKDYADADEGYQAAKDETGAAKADLDRANARAQGYQGEAGEKKANDEAAARWKAKQDELEEWYKNAKAEAAKIKDDAERDKRLKQIEESYERRKGVIEKGKQRTAQQIRDGAQQAAQRAQERYNNAVAAEPGAKKKAEEKKAAFLAQIQARKEELEKEKAALQSQIDAKQAELNAITGDDDYAKKQREEKEKELDRLRRQLGSINSKIGEEDRAAQDVQEGTYQPAPDNGDDEDDETNDYDGGYGDYSDDSGYTDSSSQSSYSSYQPRKSRPYKPSTYGTNDASMKTLVRRLYADKTNGVVASSASGGGEITTAPIGGGEMGGGGKMQLKLEPVKVDTSGNIDVNVSLVGDSLESLIVDVVTRNFPQWLNANVNNPSGGGQ